MRQKKNIERDGMLLAGYPLDMSADEMRERREWLAKQSRQYIHAVQMEEKRLTQKKLMDDLV